MRWGRIVNGAMPSQISGQIRMDASRFPMLVVEFHGKATNEQFVEYLAAMDRHLDRCDAEGCHNVLVVDTLAATSPVSAPQRKLQAEWMAKNFMRSKARMRGMAFVIDSMVVRGVLTAILWLQTMPCEYAVFGSREEAEAWVIRQLSGARNSKSPAR